jgi:hypothetical protein
VQHSRTEHPRQYEQELPWTRQRSPGGERPQDPAANPASEGPILRSICQRGTPGIPDACPMVPIMWLAQGLPARAETPAAATQLSSGSIERLGCQFAAPAASEQSSPPIAADATDKFIQDRSDFDEPVKRLVASTRCAVCPLPSDMDRVGRGEGSGARGGQGIAGTMRSRATEGLRSTRHHGRVALRPSYWRSEEGRPPPCQRRFRRLKASTAAR